MGRLSEWVFDMKKKEEKKVGATTTSVVTPESPKKPMTYEEYRARPISFKYRRLYVGPDVPVLTRGSSK